MSINELWNGTVYRETTKTRDHIVRLGGEYWDGGRIIGKGRGYMVVGIDQGKGGSTD